jgi:transcriptional regulator with XRE-family HTH domain
MMKVHEKIRSMRLSKGLSQEDMADKLYMSVNGYANIERGETDVPVSRLEKIAAAFEIELLELFSFGEKNVFYLVAAAANYNNYNSFNNCENNLQSTDSSSEKNELEHELEKARLLLQQKDKEIAYLKEINRLIKN